jgi:phosphoribosylaminoimidazolecarboxamide formyltransferase/IMP cyclohydrolase
VHTARYDATIANWLTSLDEANQPGLFPDRLQLAFDCVEALRYGENPHQQAAFYRDPIPLAGSIANYKQLQGKELSYNNIADADAAWECVKTFETPACVIIKHANPCGVAVDVSLLSAYEKAFQTDSTSAFGGIIAFNGTVDADVVAAMNVRKHFVEVLLAPAFSDAAREMLATKQNLRVLELPLARGQHAFEMKRVGGGLLLQTPDHFNVQASDLRAGEQTRTDRCPDRGSSLRLSRCQVRQVQRHRILRLRHDARRWRRPDEPRRFDPHRSQQRQNAGLDLAGSCVASDAFFPFRDGLDVLAAAGAKAVIQPGGSMRDEEVISCRRRAWPGDGVHRCQALPTLIRSSERQQDAVQKIALNRLVSAWVRRSLTGCAPTGTHRSSGGERMVMKLLVIGSGGREHALAWRLARTPGLQKVFVAPGNAGTAARA